MKKKPSLCILLITLFCTGNILAQSDSADHKSYFKAGLNYLSNAVYFGRKDSSAVPYLRPSIGYFDKSGFYISSGLAVLVAPGEPKRIDLINIDAGYNFSIKNLDAGVYASKFFYSNASFAVGSELKALGGFFGSYNLGIISLIAGGNVLFSTNTDYSTSLGISHAFESGEESKRLTITPTAQLMAGTQYFNEAYYENRKFTFTTTGNSGSGSTNSNSGKGKGKGHSNSSNSGSSGTTTTTSVVKMVTFYDRNRFTILDYELSLPVNFDGKRWGLYAVPVIAIPTNAATYAIDNAIQKEKLSTAFFVELGAYLKF